MPLLSIIVPVYNVEKYLRQCLDSLVYQTLREIEIIVVNDCSPDNSEAIILEYAEKDDRIVYIKHDKNQGLGGARNTGMRVAQGKYITFVDSDDYVDITLYAAAVQAFKEHDINVVSIPFQRFDEEGNYESFYRPYEKVYHVNLLHARTRTFHAAWSKVYYRADLAQNHFSFPEHMYWEDVPFWLEYCAVVCPKVWNLLDTAGFYYYRSYRSESITAQQHQNYWQLPQAFLFLYRRLVQRNLIDVCFKGFYMRFLDEYLFAFQFLQGKYKSLFVREFVTFVKEVQFHEKEKDIARIWYVLACSDDFITQSTVFELHVRSYLLEKELTLLTEELKINYWYNFGQLPGSGKLKKLFGLFFKHLGKVFTFKK